MENRIDKIGYFLENTFNVKMDFISLIFYKLEQYLNESKFEFESDCITEQNLNSEILIEFLNHYAKLNDGTLKIISIEECRQILNFMFNENL